MMDYCFAFIGLIIASPVLVVVGMIIKISSPGSVLYTQVRVGKNGRYFNIIKFRTMYTGAESKTGPVWASEIDT